MEYKKLAEKLIVATKESERLDLLKEIPEDQFLSIAQALKDTYYDSWTNEPQRVLKASKAIKTILKLTTNDEITALYFWVSGIALLTKGKLISAIESLNNASESFIVLGKDNESAQTQVSKLYALAMLGRYDEAINCGKEAIKIFKKCHDELAVGKVEKNIGNIFWRRDFYDDAEKRFLSAMKRFEKVGNYKELTMVENCLATVYTSQNRFNEADKVYSEALSHAKAAKMFVTEAEIESSLGNLALFRGRYDEALKYLEFSRQKYDELKMPHQVATAELEIADAYLDLNLNSEAFDIYERIVNSFKTLKMQGEEARSRANFGRVAINLGMSQIASLELHKAAKLYVSEKNLVGAAVVKLSEAQLEVSEKNYGKALKLTLKADELLVKSGNFRHQLTASWLKAECFINLKKFESAKKILEVTFIAAINQENGQIAQASQISLGKLALLENRITDAKKYFKKAIELIELLRDPLPAEEFRMAFLANKLVPYQELAKIYIREKRFAEALLFIEHSRSRTLVDSLGTENNSLKSNKVSTKLSKQLDNLREELNWFYSRLIRASDSEIEVLQEEVKKREQAITEVQRKLNNTNDKSFNKRNLIDIPKLQNQLGKDKVLIEFVGFDDEISAFVVTNQDVYFIDNLIKNDEITNLLEGLHFQFGALSYGAKNLVGFAVELKKRADFYLKKLYEKLIKPLESFLENRNLVIIPFGKLHYVPFNALHDGDCYLIEKREVSTAPSAFVFQICFSKPERKLKNALFIGYADEKIPLVNEEIKTLSNIFDEKVALTGENATFANFNKYADKFDILHIACHGEFRQDNPMFSSLRLSDGWITVRDVCSMKLNTELVTLSACETGLNLLSEGEELLGLSRGFLSAGASTLLLSLWNVNDEATQNLMKYFYTEVKKGKSFSESLRTSQISFISQNSHPYYWSPFVIIGKC